MANHAQTVARIVQASGKVYIHWTLVGSGHNFVEEFDSLADARERTRDTLSGEPGRRFLRATLMARYLRQDPTGATPALLVGKAITYDDTLDDIVKVT